MATIANTVGIHSNLYQRAALSEEKLALTEQLKQLQAASGGGGQMA